MPEAAFLVGQRGIDGGIVEIEDFLARITLIVLLDGVGDRERDCAAIALHNVPCALVQCLLELDQRFLGVDLVVERQQLDLFAVDAAGRVDRVDVELMRLLRQNAGCRGAAGQRIDEGDLDVCDCRHGGEQRGDRR